MDCNILSDHKENSNRIILLNLIFLCIWEFITAIYLSTNSYLEIEEASRLVKPANFIRGGVLFWSQTFWWQQYRLVETEDINWKKKKWCTVRIEMTGNLKIHMTHMFPWRNSKNERLPVALAGLDPPIPPCTLYLASARNQALPGSVIGDSSWDPVCFVAPLNSI